LEGVQIDKFEVGCCSSDHEHENVVVSVDSGCLEISGSVAAFQEYAGQDRPSVEESEDQDKYDNSSGNFLLAVVYYYRVYVADTFLNFF
jgi:hypothetical protein